MNRFYAILFACLYCWPSQAQDATAPAATTGAETNQPALTVESLCMIIPESCFSPGSPGSDKGSDGGGIIAGREGPGLNFRAQELPDSEALAEQDLRMIDQMIMQRQFGGET